MPNSLATLSARSRCRLVIVTTRAPSQFRKPGICVVPFAFLYFRLQSGQLLLFFERKFSFSRRLVIQLLLVGPFPAGAFRLGNCRRLLFRFSSFDEVGIVSRVLTQTTAWLKTENV